MTTERGPFIRARERAFRENLNQQSVAEAIIGVAETHLADHIKASKAVQERRETEVAAVLGRPKHSSRTKRK